MIRCDVNSGWIDLNSSFGCYSVLAAGGDLNKKWPVLTTDRPLPFRDSE